MSTIWKLNGTAAAALGISRITLNRQSQRPDECTLTAALPFDADDLFAHGATVVVTRNDGGGAGDVPYFVGRCERDDRAASGDAEHHTIKLLGPWWYLENRVYRQTWIATGGGSVPTTYVILGSKPDCSRATQGEIMADALSFCIGTGAPFQVGTVDDAGLIPMDEANDITCAEVIHRCLRWAPDAVVWFDYSTTDGATPPHPLPTVNIKRRVNMTAASLPATATIGYNVSEVQCQPCYSLQLGGVRLFFNVDQNHFPSVIQTAGDITGFQVLESTINLAGAKGDVLLNKVEVTDLPVDQIDEAWWTKNVPWLADVDDLVLSSGDLDNTLSIAGEDDIILMEKLEDGSTITDWMKNNQGIHSKACEATVTANYTIGGTECEQEIRFKYTACDAETKSYNWGSGFTPPETAPTGLATAIFSALSPLHWEGSLTLVAAEIGAGAALLGRTLNLTGGKAAWASMAALITGVREDLFYGRTTITFGPPPCLSANDLMAIALMNRIRVPAGSAQSKKDGGTANSANMPSVGGAGGGSGGVSSGMPKISKLVVTSTDDPPKTVTIDPADTNDTVFNMVFVTDYGTESALLWSLPVKKKGDVLVITGDATRLEPYACP